MRRGLRPPAVRRAAALRLSSEARPPPWLSVVLVKPRMPGNTGNIGRTCLGAGASLHLVEPLFTPTLERATRSGLDYWDRVDCAVHDDADAFVRDVLPTLGAPAFFTKAGDRSLLTARLFPEGGDAGSRVALVLGSETDGFESLLPRHADALRPAVAVPMTGDIRCYNLAATAAMAVFEATRQRYEATGLEPS